MNANKSDVFLTSDDFLKLQNKKRRYYDDFGLLPWLLKRKRKILSAACYLLISSSLVLFGLLAAVQYGLPGWYGGLI